ncbi:hypothetical protein GX50_06696, partial [[Emmonsia] crescens]
MASLQSSPHNNNTINIPQNHGPHNSTSNSTSTSASLATAREEKPTHSHSRSRPPSNNDKTKDNDNVVGAEEPPDRRRTTTTTTTSTTAIGNNDQSYQDATELVDLPPLPPPDHNSDDEDNDRNPNNHSRSSSISTISSGSVRLVVQRTTSTSDSVENNNKGILAGLKRYWFRYVSVTVPRSQNRDHFALERTYLAYIRTSLAFAFQGVLIAQLFSLQNRQKPDTAFGFYAVGRPLACACHACAIAVAA